MTKAKKTTVKKTKKSKAKSKAKASNIKITKSSHFMDKILAHTNMTQRELATRLKVSQSAVSSWKCKVSKPSTAVQDKILKLAKKKGLELSTKDFN